MRRRTRSGRWRIPLLLAGLIAAGPHTTTAQQRDHNGKTLESTSSARDPSSAPLERILLLLEPSATQEKSLDTLLEAQQTPGNPLFHSWVTTTEFAGRFAVSAADAAKVAGWLQGQGFAVAPLPASRGWVEFSGSATQVEQAFGVKLSAVADDSGSIRYRLAGTATMPAAIASLAKGLVSLDGSQSEAAATTPTKWAGTLEALAAQTSINKTQPLTPALAQGWLHVAGLESEGTTGSGESIAIVSRSYVSLSDFAAFRASFKLPEMALEVNLSGAAAGTEAGWNGDEAAAMLAVSWAGVAAPGARIVLVPAESTNATDGVDLALAAAIDGEMAHSIAVGYSSCESAMSAVRREFYAALYRQAAAEGIAVIAASGDSGAAACHLPRDAGPVAGGWAVNGLASTPWNTAVGAVGFSANGHVLTAWQPGNATGAAYATGGGASALYASPAWQTAPGVPQADPGIIRDMAPALSTLVTAPAAAERHRFLPDVTLPTAAGAFGSQGLAFCFGGEAAGGGCHLVSSGGSGASAAIFAGIAALLAEKYGPQGNLASNLYALSRHFANTPANDPVQPFVDVAQGSAKLPCVVRSPGCNGSQIGFDAAAGFDLASGLGAVNAQALVNGWLAADATGTSPVTVEMTTAGGMTYNPSAIITLSARVLSGSGGTVPTGTVQFYDQTVRANTGSPVTLDSSGNASYQENGQFTVGGHNLAAIYSGDSTYEALESQPVVIEIEPSPTSLIVAPSTTTPTSGSTITVTGTVTATNPGNSPPTGTVTINLDGLPQGNATLATSGTTTSGSVKVTVPSAGSHTVQGIYSGDVNYNNSTSPSVTITVAKEATVTSIAAAPSTLTAGVPETFTATIAPATSTTTTYTITGTVSFYDGGTTLLGTAAISSNTAILTGILLSTTTAHTITAVYSGDTSWGASVSSPLLLQPILLPVTVTLAASNSVLAPGQSATLTATVTPVSTPISTAEQHPTGNVLFYAGTTLLGEQALSAGLGDTGVATVFVPSLPAGAYVVTAQYAGDTTYGPAVSNSLGFAVEDFTVTCSGNNVTVVQGQTAKVTCNVASLGGLTGPIQVACAEQNPAQVGAIGCTFNPTVVNGTGQTTLTIATTAANGTLSSRSTRPQLPRGHGPSPGNGPPLWPAAGGAALALAGLMLSPIGRRARWLRGCGGRVLGLAVLLAGLSGAGLGCSSSKTLTSNQGTPLGVHTLKITAAADVNTVTVSRYAYVTVNVTP